MISCYMDCPSPKHHQDKKMLLRYAIPNESFRVNLNKFLRDFYLTLWFSEESDSSNLVFGHEVRIA